MVTFFDGDPHFDEDVFFIEVGEFSGCECAGKFANLVEDIRPDAADALFGRASRCLFGREEVVEVSQSEEEGIVSRPTVGTTTVGARRGCSGGEVRGFQGITLGIALWP